MREREHSHIKPRGAPITSATFSQFMRARPAPKGKFTFLSLFSGGGIGDYGLSLAGGQCVGACEIDENRRSAHLANLGAPLWGDIAEDRSKIVRAFRKTPPDLVIATPPCQSFSTANASRGRRDDHAHAALDPRNALFFEALATVSAIKPRIAVFENVPNFLERRVSNQMVQSVVGRVQEFMDAALTDYVRISRTMCLSGLGLPQRRKRAVVIYLKRSSFSDMPAALELMAPENWPGRLSRTPRSIATALKGMRRLSGQDVTTSSCASDPLHSVPTYSPQHYSWIAAIPPNSGRSAWENACSDCGSSATPSAQLNCVVCGSAILTRPHVTHKGQPRPIKGFATSYRRALATELAPTITTASGHFSSDLKLHFEENRVLSPRECAVLQTIPHTFTWPIELRHKRNYLIREMIGEALPPLVTYRLGLAIAELVSPRRA